MNDDEARDECALLVARMRPHLVAARIGEYVRGGLPAQSIPEGSRSSSHPLPSLDRADLDQLAIFANYHRHLHLYAIAARNQRWRHALIELRAAFVIETGVIPEQHLSTEQLKDLHDRARRLATLDHGTRSVECINENCTRVMEGLPNDRPRAGRCGACYEYWRTHDHTDRPLDLCSRDDERRTA